MIKIEYMKIKFVSICYIVLNAGDYEYDNFRNTVNEWSQKMLKQNDEAKTLLKFTTTSIQDLIYKKCFVKKSDCWSKTLASIPLTYTHILLLFIIFLKVH